MIGLGIWQLERRKEKEALLASYAAAANLPPIGWPSVPPKEPLPLFRSATANCLSVTGFRTAPGRTGKAIPAS
jgi:surfeit locus 1 family protein